MVYIRKDGTVAHYNYAEAMSRYRQSIGKFYCVFCNKEGMMSVYTRHCTTNLHNKAKEEYLKNNPEPPPVIHRVKDGLRDRKPKPRKQVIVPSYYIEYENEDDNVNPAALH